MSLAFLLFWPAQRFVYCDNRSLSGYQLQFASQHSKREHITEGTSGMRWVVGAELWLGRSGMESGWAGTFFSSIWKERLCIMDEWKRRIPLVITPLAKMFCCAFFTSVVVLLLSYTYLFWFLRLDGYCGVKEPAICIARAGKDYGLVTFYP